jgi:hypothetical protein
MRNLVIHEQRGLQIDQQEKSTQAANKSVEVGDRAGHGFGPIAQS